MIHCPNHTLPSYTVNIRLFVSWHLASTVNTGNHQSAGTRIGISFPFLYLSLSLLTFLLLLSLYSLYPRRSLHLNNLPDIIIPLCEENSGIMTANQPQGDAIIIGIDFGTT